MKCLRSFKGFIKICLICFSVSFEPGYAQDVGRAISSDDSVYGPRQKVAVTVNLKGYDVPEGSVAVSVIDRSAVSPDTSTTIESQLLLQSELHGHIEDAGWYFTTTDTLQADKALDALMLTQGWCRYDIPAVLHGRFVEPLKPLEISQEISGKARSLWKGKPLKDASAEIIAPSIGYADKVSTDENGEFQFSAFNFPDSTYYLIQVLNKKGNPERNIEVYPQPTVDIPSRILHHYDPEMQRVLSTYSPLAASLRMKSIQLMEVVVEAQKHKDYDDFYRAIAKKSFDSKYIEDNMVTKLTDALQHIAGMTFMNGNAYYRGLPTAYMIDGSIFFYGADSDKRTRYGEPANRLREFEQQFTMEMIKRIDFIPPGAAVLFGGRSTGGIISVTTKRGEDWTKIRNPISPEFRLIRPLGYQRPAEFYSPKYDVDTSESTEIDSRITLYWTPDARIDSSGLLQFDFYTNDNPVVNCQIVVEGLTDSGQPIHSTNNFKN